MFRTRKREGAKSPAQVCGCEEGEGLRSDCGQEVSVEYISEEGGGIVPRPHPPAFFSKVPQWTQPTPKYTLWPYLAEAEIRAAL
jgi:hypothetical protein